MPATAAPSPTPLEARATLPPTWTPVILPTETATVFAPTQDLTATAILMTPTQPGCINFGEDGSRSVPEFTLGERPVVFWLPVDGATEYELRVYDAADDRTIYQSVEATLQHTLPAELFVMDGSYYWLVRPIDTDGMPVCPSAGGILYPVVR